MSKFCTQCGRPLQEGEICSCQLPIGNPGTGQYPSQFNSDQLYRDQGNGGQPSPGQPFSGQPNQGQPYGSQYNQGQPSPGQPSNGQPYPGQPSNGQPYPGQLSNGQPYSGQFHQGQPFPAQQAGAQAAAYAQDFFKMILSTVKSPVIAGREMVMKADLKVSLLLILLEGILNAFFVSAIALSVVLKIKASMGGLSALAPDMSVPFFRILIFFVLYAFAKAAIFAAIMLVGHIAIKVPASFQQMLSLSGVKSLSLLPGIIVALILCVLNIYVGMVVFALAVFWGNIVVLVTMTSLIPQGKLNKFAVMLCIGLLVSAFVGLFVLGLVGSSFIPDVMDLPF